ncbi:hypothetical protein Bca52824_079575 [Brassica carinata]|uniref:Peptidase A1 domain-containing protein n=1 Tax=Brassica carinata TaxID=52824 RepID=A0A8X7U0V5_BRACI|nr:hypothetical protein Bca52824_079575 [Brassica carinata]
MIVNFSTLISFLALLVCGVSSNPGVFNVKYRYPRLQGSLSALKEHDDKRQLTILAGIDLPLGGTGRPDILGLYYAKIGIGTPAKSYYVQVDTGSDIMWVNCIQCKQCPKRSNLGIELTLYDIRESESAKLVSCDEDFCYQISGVLSLGAKLTCRVLILRFMEMGALLLYDSVAGDLKTKTANGSVIFGCGARQSGDLDASNEEALDGILGFGKANSSMISQLASSGRVKKIFAHCLDGRNGGGIFAIGRVVQPKVNMTPLVPNQPHYNVNMTAVQVGQEFLDIPADLFQPGDRKGAIIDSGTTLAYLPEIIYEPLVKKITSQEPSLKVHIVDKDYKCFQYSGRVDEGFPNVTFHFENSVYLRVYPHDYLFPYEGMWCIGWQNSGMQSRDRRNMTLLGDLVLSNKLVLYDLENQLIGWTEYNCSSSIKVKDEGTGTVHLVGSHFISSAFPLDTSLLLLLLLLLITLYLL